MHTLHLSMIRSDQPVRAIKAVRAAREALGEGIGLANARAIVDDFVESGAEPQLLGGSEDPVAVRTALLRLRVEDCDGIIDYEGDLEPDDVEDPENDDAPDVLAYRTALALMAFADGNPSVALMYSKTLINATGAEEFFESVGTALTDVFPLRDGGEVQVG